MMIWLRADTKSKREKPMDHEYANLMLAQHKRHQSYVISGTIGRELLERGVSASVTGSASGVLSRVARISANVLWEKVSRPRPSSNRDVPRSVEAVTPAWLTAVLCQDVPAAKVTRCTFLDAHHGTSVHQRIRIEYNAAGSAAGLPTITFTKSTPTIFTRMVNGLTGTMADEALFYRRVRPHLAIEAPIGYHSAYDLASFRSLHMLEDLVETKSASFCTVRNHFTREQAEQAVDLLASLHEQALAAGQVVPLAKMFRTWPRWISDGDKLADLQPNIEAAVLEIASLIPSDIVERRGEIWPFVKRSFEDHARYPHTLLHSDPHPGNWYVTGDGRMGLCDWQCIALGIWARDVAYALSTMLTVEDRRAWERDLLQRYLAKAPSDITGGVGFDEAWDLYRAQVPCGMSMWSANVVRPKFHPEMQPKEVGMEVFKRVATAMSDLRSLDVYDGADRAVRREPG